MEIIKDLSRLPSAARKEWLQKHLKEILSALEKTRNISDWNLIGQTLINENLYKEAETVYDFLFRIMQKSRGDFGAPAYMRGIARFLQGRFKDAFEDFRAARQYDMHMKNINSPSAKAISYMEETIFPARDMIKRNQERLIKNLNVPRQIDYKMGAYVLRTIHKWNSASPLFSRGLSQGGGYFLSLRSARGEVKGIAVDPGYDFFSIFRDLGLGIADIDAIIITHDHDDHTESLEGILSLLAKHNDHNQERKSKVIDIFGSAGVLLKFNGLLSATDPNGNKEINFKLLIPGNTINNIEGVPLFEKYGFNLHVKAAYHNELWTSQESAVGVVIETTLKTKDGKNLHIGITGDTRYVEGLGKGYRDCQVILLNIGSIEKEEGKLLGQHLGMLGSINLLKEARLNEPLLAILTEFGEEFSGKRETISKIIEDWAQPLSLARNNKDFKVIPADLNLEVKLDDLSIRDSDTHVFFHYSTIGIEEKNPELLKYKFNG